MDKPNQLHLCVGDVIEWYHDGVIYSRDVIYDISTDASKKGSFIYKTTDVADGSSDEYSSDHFNEDDLYHQGYGIKIIRSELVKLIYV